MCAVSDRWQANTDSEGDTVRVSHNVTNFEFLYEPFYVAPDTVPPHDERFLGYGYTRNTQVSGYLPTFYGIHRLLDVFARVSH
jgi:N-acetyllactosaminide beta-1,3-N-acetylglucosaminyltransferase